MVFSRDRCVIRKIYCGNGRKPSDTKDKKYSRVGSRHECMKRGFGVADWEHRKKGLSSISLQQIPYIGEKYETNFKKARVYTIRSLMSRVRIMSVGDKKKLIEKGCKRAGGSIDKKAFNSVVLFLDDRGVKNLPNCSIVRE